MNQKHSGLGIASFVISLFACFAMMVLFVIAGVAQTSTPGGLKDDSPEAMLIGLGIIGDGMILFLALVLGVAALFQEDRNKLFAILGAMISGLAVLGTAGLIAVGLMVGD